MASKARSKSASRNRPAGLRGATDGGGWSQSVTRRAGRPPLRFKGRLLFRQAEDGPGSAPSVTFWIRKTKGYVAAVDAGQVVDSVYIDTLDDAMSWLEDVCRHQPANGLQASFGDLLTRLPADIAARRTLRILAGRLLDEIDQMSDDDGSSASQERK